MRQWSSFFHRWRFLMAACAFVYVMVLYLPRNMETVEKVPKGEGKEAEASPPVPVHRAQRRDPVQTDPDFEYEFRPVGRDPFYVSEVLTNFGISLKEKMTCKADKDPAKAKILVSINAGHGQEHLGGCPDWNCKFTYDRSLIDKADALLLAHEDGGFKQRADQYVIYFSQESPKNSGFFPRNGLQLNMTLGFRHDSAVASPYGYTVRLAKRSRPTGPMINQERIRGKKKPAAWFVSHCNTNSWRERIIERMQKEGFPVDVYGACGPLKCPRGGQCETMLDDDYFFYVAFENSICKDYITEKLWSQGYQREIVPLVMKRALVEPFVPPNSFIALDDFQTIDALTVHLNYLMKNLTAYEEYFAWKKEYRVIFLNGQNHDVLERPWGFCQICRLMWEQPKIEYRIENFEKYWTQSCEVDGQLAKGYVDFVSPKS